jgi:hypothetical protein
VLFSNLMLLGVDIPLVGTPSIGIETRYTKRLQQGLQLQKDPIFALSTDISHHLPTVMINRVPPYAANQLLARQRESLDATRGLRCSTQAS